ncbi:hypothetical protein HA466_0319850 [Hirschfeldia incana]|nr:hypothetical protein HA466_0319850 [Hirschfeldia incana]
MSEISCSRREKVREAREREMVEMCRRRHGKRLDSVALPSQSSPPPPPRGDNIWWYVSGQDMRWLLLLTTTTDQFTLPSSFLLSCSLVNFLYSCDWFLICLQIY